MMSIFRFAFCILILFVFSGCATMNKSECLEADWQVLGLEDGAEGHKLSYIGERRKACAEYGVAPNLEQYQIGREAGLKQFCTYGNGYSQASRGFADTGVCQGALQASYSEGFNNGRVIYDMGKEIDSGARHIRSKHSELAALDEDIRRIESRLISHAGSRSSRKNLLDDYTHLQADREALANYIHDQEIGLIRKEEERDALISQYNR